MDTATSEATSTKSTVLFEGKTKIGREVLNRPDDVLIESKDDITAGNGKMHDAFHGKGILCNIITTNVFELLKSRGLPVAFHHKLGQNSFLAPRCEMEPFEVVVRRKADGSYLKRNQSYSKWETLSRLQPEFYLKTSGKKWRGDRIPVDDPLLAFRDGTLGMYFPDRPLYYQEPFGKLELGATKFREMGELVCKAFEVIETAWRDQDLTLIDLKLEFGHNAKGALMIADVIDNDSWRLAREDGEYMCKQYYRQTGDVAETRRRYACVAAKSRKFAV